MSEFDDLLDDDQAASEDGFVVHLAGNGNEPDREPLPPDIEEVWGQGRLNAGGQLAANTAHHLIGAWGLEKFRASAIHRLAVEQTGRETKTPGDWRNRDLKAFKDKP